METEDQLAIALWMSRCLAAFVYVRVVSRGLARLAVVPCPRQAHGRDMDVPGTRMPRLVPNLCFVIPALKLRQEGCLRSRPAWVTEQVSKRNQNKTKQSIVEHQYNRNQCTWK